MYFIVELEIFGAGVKSTSLLLYLLFNKNIILIGPDLKAALPGLQPYYLCFHSLPIAPQNQPSNKE